MLVLKKWTKGMTPHNVCFTHIPLWVQVWGLPFELLNEEMARDIGKVLGTILDIDNTAFNSKQSRFLRIHVDIPLSKPLRRKGPALSPKGNKVWIAFKYERINELCFTCGKLEHEMKACHQKTSNTGGIEHPYGDRMRVEGKRRNDEGNHRENSPPGKSQPTWTNQAAVQAWSRNAQLTGSDDC